MRIGRNRITLAFSVYNDANSLMSSNSLKTSKLKAFIPSFNVTKIGLLRGVPPEEVIENISVPEGSGGILKGCDSPTVYQDQEWVIGETTLSRRYCHPHFSSLLVTTTNATWSKRRVCLIPPKFQWKTIGFVWASNEVQETAMDNGDFIPENNIPTGIARWKDKLFITIPRWKKGVPSSLNYVYVNGTQEQLLNPYPSWAEAFIPQNADSAPHNSTVVCAFRAHVDSCSRLWVVDNGVADITGDAKQLVEPGILIFDLETNQLLHKYELEEEVLRDSSVFTSVVVDVVPNKAKDCSNSYAYITDMGSNAIVVYSLNDNEAWRVENPYFHFDPHAGVYKVGGIDFYWSDGVSSAALSKPNNQGYRDLYFHPTSSTKQFKMSTKLLRNKDTPNEDIFNGVVVIGDKGPKTQATACDYDTQNNVLFYSQLSRNGIGCWNTEKPFNAENNALIFSDCNMMEFPNDIKVDHEGNLWMLSNRQSRFLYGTMDFNEINFRVLTAPTAQMIRGTPCEKQTTFSKLFSCSKTPGSASSKKSGKSNKTAKLNSKINMFQ